MNPKPDEAVVHDSSAYHPKTFEFELKASGIKGIRNKWEKYSCERYEETLTRDLLDCVNERHSSIVHLDLNSGIFVEWLLMSGGDWSSAVMYRGKCDKIGR